MGGGRSDRRPGWWRKAAALDFVLPGVGGGSMATGHRGGPRGRGRPGGGAGSAGRGGQPVCSAGGGGEDKAAARDNELD